MFGSTGGYPFGSVGSECPFPRNPPDVTVSLGQHKVDVVRAWAATSRGFNLESKEVKQFVEATWVGGTSGPGEDFIDAPTEGSQ